MSLRRADILHADPRSVSGSQRRLREAGPQLGDPNRAYAIRPYEPYISFAGTSFAMTLISASLTPCARSVFMNILHPGTGLLPG